MLNKTNQEFRKSFLLQFTAELIRNSNSSELFKLKHILEQEQREKELKESVRKEIIKQTLLPTIQKEIKEQKLKEFVSPIQKQNPIVIPKKRPFSRRRQILRIPNIRLPQNLSYLQPTATNTEIDLGKLNPLIKDPLVREIHCSGPDQNIVVQGNMGTKPTSIVLNNSEIDLVIKRFSQASKIPDSPGIYKVIVGKLILSAIISEVVGSRFIINKIRYDPKFMPMK
ncbi:MAG: hypothetical protein KJ949_02795 [Nanoarchaeota archaeon]|nr:hypothetical protein [Nanoarchaeota archaeon]